MPSLADPPKAGFFGANWNRRAFYFSLSHFWIQLYFELFGAVLSASVWNSGCGGSKLIKEFTYFPVNMLRITSFFWLCESPRGPRDSAEHWNPVTDCQDSHFSSEILAGGAHTQGYACNWHRGEIQEAELCTQRHNRCMFSHSFKERWHMRNPATGLFIFTFKSIFHLTPPFFPPTYSMNSFVPALRPLYNGQSQGTLKKILYNSHRS